MRRQTYGYLPSRRKLPSLNRYQIILLAGRGTCVRTTCPRLLPIYLVRLHLAGTNTIQSSMHFVVAILQPDRTCRLDVFEEVHLPSTSFLKAILERVDGWRINIFLRQAIPAVYNPLRKEVQTCITSTIFLSSPASSCVLWYKCLSPVEETGPRNG